VLHKMGDFKMTHEEYWKHFEKCFPSLQGVCYEKISVNHKAWETPSDETFLMIPRGSNGRTFAHNSKLKTRQAFKSRLITEPESLVIQKKMLMLQMFSHIHHMRQEILCTHCLQWCNSK
jgi:hypothetical protein